MDETKGGQDTSQTGDTSDKLRGTSEQPKTYNKESEEKAISDALSTAGRDAKSITEKSTEAQRILEAAQRVQADIQAEQERWQRDRDEADREAVRQDPEALKSLEERIRQRNEATKLAKREQELGEKETKHKERLEKADKVTKEQNARDIATKHTVDAESLIKFTDGSKEAMEELALQLPKKGETKSPLHTDSSTTIGGGASFEQIRDDMIKNPSNDAKMRRYLDAKKERDAQK